MTNSEAIIAAIGMPLPGDTTLSVQKSLLDSGLVDTDIYGTGNKIVINAAALVVMKGLNGLKSIQEGGYTIVYDFAARIAAIETELGLRRPTIQNKSYLW